MDCRDLALFEPTAGFGERREAWETDQFQNNFRFNGDSRRHLVLGWFVEPAMSQDAENNFDFTGMVTIDPEFQIQPSGYMKGTLTVRWVNRYKKGEDWVEKDVDVPFVLFGKPAEKAEALNLKAGMLVRVSFSLDTFKGYPQLRPWRVDLRTNQNPGKGPEKAQEEQVPHSDPETLDDANIPF